MYRGTDGLERPVAIKRLHAPLSKRADFVDMSFDEAQIAASINHPGLCALYDFGRSDDGYFLAMEYLIGETFQRVTAAICQRSEGAQLRRLPCFAARLFADAAEALHAAHEARDADATLLGIVHRDVTPSNLFLLYDGSVRVTDFGIATSREQLHHTEPGVLEGKVPYMAPEQLRPGPSDRRCDVWALGVALWEMLTQQVLFSGTELASTIEAVETKPVLAPSVLHPLVPPELDRIVLRALSRDPRERHQTARELALDLERFLSQQHDSVPSAELADWLSELFPNEESYKRSLVRRAFSLLSPSPAPHALAAR
jgi:serine/threonine-protein kinase